MIKIRRLPESLRRKLKTPIGVLIQGSSDETVKKLEELIRKEKPPKIISVGDTVSENMTRHGILPDVLVVDNKVMRKPINPISVNVSKKSYAQNPPGTLTDEAWNAIKEAVNCNQRTMVIIDGEEDLLTLAAVLNAPERSFVVYGQPHEGMVVIKVTEQKKKEIEKIVQAMEQADSKS